MTRGWKINKQVNSLLGCIICKECELTHLYGLKNLSLIKIAVFLSKLAEHSYGGMFFLMFVTFSCTLDSPDSRQLKAICS